MYHRKSFFVVVVVLGFKLGFTLASHVLSP
jgi:hypothetical protein